MQQPLYLAGLLSFLLFVIAPEITYATQYAAYSLRVAQQTLTKGLQHRLSTEAFQLGGITKIKGLVFDPESRDVILVGEKDPQRASLTLDDFVVALRARFIYRQWPAVSMDPTEETKRTGKLSVRFEGGIENTQFGKDLLEADYRLKQIAFEFISPGIPNVPTLWKLYHEESPECSAKGWIMMSRFWFYPILPGVTVRENVVTTKDLKVGVFTELLAAEIDGKRVDPSSIRDLAGDKFAKEISESFQELAQIHPSFSRLQGLDELVALTKAVEELEPLPDFSFWLKDYRVKRETTKTVMEELKRRDDDKSLPADRKCPLGASGGVQLRALGLRLKAGDVTALREAVLKTRPKADTLTWGFALLGDWIIPDAQVGFDPTVVAELFAQAAFLYHSARYEDVISICDKIEQMAPELRSEILSAKANALLRQGLTLWGEKASSLETMRTSGARGTDLIQRSFSLFEESIKVKPTCSECHHDFGVALRGFGKLAEAAEHFEEALKINPNSYASHYGLGLIFYQTGKYEQSVMHINEYLKSSPSGEFAEQARETIRKMNSERNSRLLKYTNGDLGLSFKYPSSWTLMTPRELEEKTKGMADVSNAVVFLVDEKDFDRNVNIKVFQVPKESASVTELAQLEGLLDQQYPKQFPGFRKVSARVLAISGVNALEYVSETVRIDRSLRQKGVLVIKGGRNFVATFTAPSDNFEQVNVSCFQIILNTLELR